MSLPIELPLSALWARGDAAAPRIATPGAQADIGIRPKTVVVSLWAATALVLSLGLAREIMLALYGAGTFLQDFRHIALDTEHSLPVWYSSLLMAIIAALLAVLALMARRGEAENRLQWMLLAVVFLLMSMDESVSFHESTIEPLRAAFGLSGILYFGWVIIAAPLLVVMGLLFLPFLFRLPRPVMARFVLAGSVYVFGAFGLEFVGGYFASTSGMESAAYKLAASAEECLEVLGLTLFAAALIALIAKRAPTLTVHLRG